MSETLKQAVFQSNNCFISSRLFHFSDNTKIILVVSEWNVPFVKLSASDKRDFVTVEDKTVISIPPSDRTKLYCETARTPGEQLLRNKSFGSNLVRKWHFSVRTVSLSIYLSRRRHTEIAFDDTLFGEMV